MKSYYYEIFARQIGSYMRFFLNSSLVLMISSAFSLLILMDLQQVTPMRLLLGGIPLIAAAFFFITFLLMLKRIEKYAVTTKNIDILSNVISEYNKSYIFKLVTGKIDPFIEI